MKRLLITLGACLAGAAGLSAERPVIVAGGVSGLVDLANPAHSESFRAEGGGLYLHNNGWAVLNARQRQAVLNPFRDLPLGIELGYRPSGKAWAGIYRRHYRNLKPDFIAAHAFAGDEPAKPADWKRYTDELRAAGVPDKTLILPAFGGTDCASPIPTPSETKVSEREDFREIIAMAGGMVVDVPVAAFVRGEQSDRDWVVDAVRWCRAEGHTAIVVASPCGSAERFPDEVRRFVDYLCGHGAQPNIWVVKNYSSEDPARYVNRVGSEEVPYEILGTARLLQQELARIGGQQ